MYRRRLLLIVAVVLALSQEAFTQKPSPDPESLVRQLAGKRARIPKRPSGDLDVVALPIDPQVAEAIQELKELGTAAFPALITHRQDRRYSHTVGGSAFANHAPGTFVRIDKSVGETCMEILTAQLRVGHQYKGCAYFIPDRVSENSLPDWWKERSSKSLSEIRKEVLEWTIAEEKRRSIQGRVSVRDLAKHRAEKLEAELRAAQP